MDKVVQADELRQNDGKEGRPAYVVYQGKVYDVSGSRMWREGTHVRRHNAGQDLTESFPAAPHDTSVFERVKFVGELAAAAEEKPEPEIPALLDWGLNRHPHGVAVHFPIAYAAAVFVLLILSFLTGENGFETASYYMLWGVVIMAPVAIALGVMVWSISYRRLLSGPVMGKIMLSVALLIVGIAALALRVSNPGIFVTPAEPMRWVYFALVFIIVLLVSGLGWLGDVIMYGK